jgi:hypothetical protein
MFSGLLATFLPYVIGAVLAIGAFFAVRQSGAKAERAKQDRARLDAIHDKKEIDDEVDALGPADVDARFDRWMRDGKR